MNEQAVISAAIEWWRGRRPVVWNEKQHLENPTTNTANDAEKKLARAVAAYLAEADTEEMEF